MSEIVLTIEGIDPLEFFGEKNSKLKLLKAAFPDVKMSSRGNKLKLDGEKNPTQKAKAKIEKIIRLIKTNKGFSNEHLKDVLSGENVADDMIAHNTNGSGNVIVYGKKGRAIKARTKNQKKLIELSDANDILFAVGPAGTGKTYTAVALAVKALKNRLVDKIILTRPAVEAGESLGFLPGDLKDKIDPYLRPLYDALDDMFPADKLKHLMENRVIEVAPLAFMRGRTLDNAFIILDEAQNCTSLQLKMFLTRLGPSAKCIITGDLSQIDLPRNQKSGLFKALDILSNINGIAKIVLQPEDVVRHRLVKAIIQSYEVNAETFKENERR